MGCLAFAIWSAYDGFYAYPKKIPQAKAYGELLEKIESDPNLSDADRVPMWKEIADENGWSSKLLQKDDSVASIEAKIIYQYVFIAIGLGIGAPCLVWYLRNRNTWIESTDDGIRASWGQELKISQIQKFDKNKWEKKGIGVLHYTTAQGDEQKFVIDDLKYERKTTDAIVRWIESQIPVEMIVNGLPEMTESEESDEDVDERVHDLDSSNQPTT
jgi:hypothetical protein